MTDLPPPPPGQPPAWQPPAGPPPSVAPTTPPASDVPTSDSPAAPIRPYLPDPRAPKAPAPAAPPAPAPPSPVAPPAADTVAPPMTPLPPNQSNQPLPPNQPPTSGWAPAPGAAPAAPATAVPSTDATPRPPFTPAGTPIAGSSATGPGAPPLPDPATTSRSRLPAIIGAVVALAIGAGAVLWITSGDDSDDDSGRSDAAATTAADEPADTAAGTTPPEPTPAPASTGPAVVLPTVAPTTPPEQTTPGPLVPVLPAPPAPEGAVPYTDPAGWSIAVDPAWEFSQSDDFTGWFTGTGSDGFADNVNVTLEDLPGPMTLDDYVVAAKGFIATSAADVAIVDERRFAGADGVEVHVITWSGSVGGGQPLAFVQAMTVTSSRAYVATFTSQPARMVDLATTIGPYLLTVRGA